MELNDALIVTGLGMAVVFTGLLLTSGLIVTFGLIGRAREARLESAPAPAASPAAAAPAEVPQDVLAVITAVLEVERRLYRAESGGRMTIRRGREEGSP